MDHFSDEPRSEESLYEILQRTSKRLPKELCSFIENESVPSVILNDFRSLASPENFEEMLSFCGSYVHATIPKTCIYNIYPLESANLLLSILSEITGTNVVKIKSKQLETSLYKSECVLPYYARNCLNKRDIILEKIATKMGCIKGTPSAVVVTKKPINAKCASALKGLSSGDMVYVRPLYNSRIESARTTFYFNLRMIIISNERIDFDSNINSLSDKLTFGAVSNRVKHIELSPIPMDSDAVNAMIKRSDVINKKFFQFKQGVSYDFDESSEFQAWRLNGLLHKYDDEPALISANGDKFWYKHGKLLGRRFFADY